MFIAKYNVGLDLLREAVVELNGGSEKKKPQAQQGRTQQLQRQQTQGKKNTPTLDEFSRDLTEYAREDKLDPVFGRGEISRLSSRSSRRTQNTVSHGTRRREDASSRGSPRDHGRTGSGGPPRPEGPAFGSASCRGTFTAANRGRLKRVMNEITASGNVIWYRECIR
jgi:ATP-dependent Clp protease ATP-binding subunit ClpC